MGLANDGGDTRPYGFWVHVVAGLTIGGALLYWWHSSDFQWALIIVVGLVFMAVGAGIRRSSYAVLGTIGLFLATLALRARRRPSEPLPTTAFGDEPPNGPASWAGPVAFLCLGPLPRASGHGALAARRGARPRPAELGSEVRARAHPVRGKG